MEGWKKGGWMAGWMVGGARACLTAHIPLGGGEGRGAGLALRPARTRAAEQQQEEEEEEESNPRRCRGPSGEEGRDDYYCIYIYIALLLTLSTLEILESTPAPPPPPLCFSRYFSLLLARSVFRYSKKKKKKKKIRGHGWLRPPVVP